MLYLLPVSAHSLYSQCSLTVQSVLTHCTASAHSLYSQCSLTVQPIQSMLQHSLTLCTASPKHITALTAQPIQSMLQHSLTLCTANPKHITALSHSLYSQSKAYYSTHCTVISHLVAHPISSSLPLILSSSLRAFIARHVTPLSLVTQY